MGLISRLIDKARQASHAGDHLEAIRHLREAIAMQPGDAQAHLLLGYELKDVGEYEASIQAFQCAVPLVGDAAARGSGRPYFGIGLALLELGRYDEAEAAFKSCAASDTSGAVHVLLGVTCGRTDREAEAADYYQKALSINPRNEEAMFNLAMLLRSDDPDKAIALLRRAIEIDCDYAIAYRELGRAVYCHLDDTLEATMLLRKALSLKEEDFDTHDYLAIMLCDEFHLYEEAEQHWLRCTHLDRQSPLPHWRLGVLYQNMRRPADAERSLKHAFELDPADVDVLYQLGWFLLDSGRRGEARVYLARACSLGQRHNEAEHIRSLLDQAEAES